MRMFESFYTREELKAINAARPWWKPKLIVCRRCDLYHDLVCVAEMQVRGVWLCDRHLPQ